MTRYAPVDPKQSFPALEEERPRALARGRHLRAPAPPSARARRSGASTRARRPPTASPAPTTSSRASSRTSTRATRRCAATTCPRKARLGLPRPAGRARGREGARDLLEGGDRGVRDRRVQRALPRVGLPLRRRLEPADRADRLLDRPRRPLRDDDNDYIESVWWSLRQIWDADRLYQGHKVVPYCPRCGTALSSHEVAQGYQDVVDPSVYVRLPVTDAGADLGPLEPGDNLLVWTTTPWTLISHAAVAVGPEIEYVARPRGRRRRGLRRRRARSPSGCSARAPRCSRAFPARRSRASATRRPSPTSRGEDFGPLGHTVLLARLRHDRGRHRPRPHRARLRRGRLPARRAVRDDAAEPGPARRHASTSASPTSRASSSTTTTRRSSRRFAQRAAVPRASTTSTPTRTAGAATRRSSTTRSRAGTSARPRSATGCSPRTSGSAGTPSTSSTAASASGWRATSTGRSRASATGARRCRSGSARARTATSASAPARSPTCASAARGEVPRGPAPPLHRRGRARLRELRRRDAPRRRGDRRLVRLGRDAVRAVPLPVRERGGVRASASRPTSSARRSTRPAAGSTRSSPSRCCCSTRPTTATASASA